MLMQCHSQVPNPGEKLATRKSQDNKIQKISSHKSNTILYYETHKKEEGQWNNQSGAEEKTSCTSKITLLHHLTYCKWTKKSKMDPVIYPNLPHLYSFCYVHSLLLLSRWHRVKHFIFNVWGKKDPSVVTLHFSAFMSWHQAFNFITSGTNS